MSRSLLRLNYDLILHFVTPLPPVIKVLEQPPVQIVEAQTLIMTIRKVNEIQKFSELTKKKHYDIVISRIPEQFTNPRTVERKVTPRVRF